MAVGTYGLSGLIEVKDKLGLGPWALSVIHFGWEMNTWQAIATCVSIHVVSFMVEFLVTEYRVN